MKLKKRRTKRKHYNWEIEIAKGHTDKFYHSTEWDELREKVLLRDKRQMHVFYGEME